MLSLDLLVFFLSSLVSLSFIYYKVSTTIIEQGVALLLILLLFLAKQQTSSISKRSISFPSRFSSKLFRSIFLILSSLFVQLLVISSGGFYSPFLILLHLYTLGSAFLLKIGSAISFLVFSLIVLLASTFLNQTLLILFKQDPGSALLYIVSFIVIIPLAEYLMSTYRLKETISKILTEHIQLGEKRERSILEGLNELVLVTDVNLKILSFNEAAQKSLTENILGNNLLLALRLKSEDGQDATIESLSIDKVLEESSTRAIEGFYLETKRDKHLKVIIQIRPVTNPAGAVNQIAFVIIDAKSTGLALHLDLEKAKKKYQVILENLKKSLKEGKLLEASLETLLLAKADEDVLLAQELEDHPFKMVITYQDLVELSQKAVGKKQELARALGVTLELTFPKEEVREVSYLSLKQSNTPVSVLPQSDFSALTDPKWFTVILEKLLDISILLVSGQRGFVDLSLNRETEQIFISVTVSPVNLTEEDKKDLFKEYFGALGQRTNLRFGSGLEGFISKTISDGLNLNIDTKLSENKLVFTYNLTKEVAPV